MGCYPWKQLNLIAFIDLVPVSTEKVSLIWSNIIWDKIHKSEPEPGNGNVNTVYFVNQARGNAESVARSLFTMNKHAIANVYLYLSFLLRIMLVKNILSQISFYA